MDLLFDRPAPRAGFVFAGVVATDGESISFLYKQPGKGEANKPPPRTDAGTPRGLGARRRRVFTHGHAPPARVHAPDEHGYRPWRRVVGVDPGITNVITAVEHVRPPGGGGGGGGAGPTCAHRWILSWAEWRAETQAAARERQAKEWQESMERRPDGQTLADHLGASPRRVASLERYLAHVRATADVFRPLLTEMLQPRWAVAAFDGWRLRHKVLANFWARVWRGRIDHGTDHVTPVVAYGNASFIGGAPTVDAYLACVEVMGSDAVRYVDEYRTSRTHHACGCVLQGVVDPVPTERELVASKRVREKKEDIESRLRGAVAAGAGGGGVAAGGAAGGGDIAGGSAPRPRGASVGAPQRREPIRGLYRCANPRCPDAGSSFVDRDVNAALNMVAAFVARDAGGRRPEHLDRGVYRGRERRERDQAERQGWENPVFTLRAGPGAAGGGWGREGDDRELGARGGGEGDGPGGLARHLRRIAAEAPRRAGRAGRGPPWAASAGGSTETAQRDGF
jgi:hypothetical protein